MHARLFICVELTESIKIKIAAFQAKLKAEHARISWTRLENMHLTLKFLGDSPISKIDEMKTALADVAQQSLQIEQKFNKAGAFPNLKNPRVFWIGSDEINPHLRELASAIDDRMQAFGFQKEKRAFKPHLTIGRVRSRNCQDVVQQIQEMQPPQFELNSSEIVLMQSEILKNGPVYTALGKFTLK